MHSHLLLPLLLSNVAKDEKWETVGFGGVWTCKVEKWRDASASDHEIKILLFWPFYFFSSMFFVSLFYNCMVLVSSGTI